MKENTTKKFDFALTIYYNVFMKEMEGEHQWKKEGFLRLSFEDCHGTTDTWGNCLKMVWSVFHPMT